ncbi:MAG: hypothetical protein KKH73_03765, partial [Actinobacteria bacterium]|nr:hypothetical protein [Actinomycetota bacterium]
FGEARAGSEKYLFEVPEEDVRVRINNDSSLDFWYKILFKNDPSADPIDIVDIGMPTPYYLPDECAASINGVTLTDIRASTVVSPGVEVHLGDMAIPPGQEGTFEFHGKNPEMVFGDTERQGYASVQFKNTWWDSEYAKGRTYLSFSIQFPPGVQNNETVYHGQAQPNRSDVEGSIIFTWNVPDAKPTEGYLFGVSFPAAYVEGVYPEKPPPDYSPVYSGTTSSGSGGSRNIWMYGIFIVFGIVAALARSFESMRRVKGEGGKAQYIAPAVGVEGAGPMKDLFPAEAAVLMNQELDRVAAIAYLEMIQKGLVSIAGTKPLSLARAQAAPESLPGDYGGFLVAISPDGSLEPQALQLALTTLIRSVEDKARGFSHAETVKYYEDAADRAWIEVKSEADHNARMERFNQYLPFLLLDPGFNSKVREAFSAGGFPMQQWAIGLTRAAGTAGTGVTTSADGGLTVQGVNFAESVAGGFRSIQDSVFTHVEDFKEDIVKEVNPREYRRIYRTRRYYGGYGGGGGGCACACAGCACACAGGGR